MWATSRPRHSMVCVAGNGTVPKPGEATARVWTQEHQSATSSAQGKPGAETSKIRPIGCQTTPCPLQKEPADVSVIWHLFALLISSHLSSSHLISFLIFSPLFEVVSAFLSFSFLLLSVSPQLFPIHPGCHSWSHSCLRAVSSPRMAATAPFFDVTESAVRNDTRSHSSAATLASRQLLPFSSLFSSALLILSLCLSSFVSTVLNLLISSHLFSTLPAFSQLFSQLFSAIASFSQYFFHFQHFWALLNFSLLVPLFSSRLISSQLFAAQLFSGPKLASKPALSARAQKKCNFTSLFKGRWRKTVVLNNAGTAGTELGAGSQAKPQLITHIKKWKRRSSCLNRMLEFPSLDTQKPLRWIDSHYPLTSDLPKKAADHLWMLPELVFDLYQHIITYPYIPKSWSSMSQVCPK